MEKNGNYLNKKNFLIFLILMFLKYTYDFLLVKEYGANVINLLFKMIIILSLIIGIIHKKIFKEVKCQTYIDDYFKRNK